MPEANQLQSFGKDHGLVRMARVEYLLVKSEKTLSPDG